VSAAAAFDLWTLREQRTPVAYENDLSVHTAMVRFASERIAGGHLPWTSWFPYIGLGSPQFLHYQSLPAVLAGLLARAVSPMSAVSWTTYLLLGTWPLSVYICGRLFSLRPWSAAWAAVASPFVSTTFSSGYEQRAYIFLGYGLWTQLFAMWTLPVAWGLTWRAVSTHRFRFAASFAIALTVCLHFETGYLALLGLVVFPVFANGARTERARSAGFVAVGALVLSAWAWVPLIADRHWSAVNSVLANTAYQKGYSLPKMLWWLITGRLFDNQSVVPVITTLGAIGLLVALARWRREPATRAILAIGVCSLLLEGGTSTYGPISYLLPGHQDIYFRRFAVGFQLSWLLLAGTAAVALVDWMARLVAGGDRPGEGPTRNGLAPLARSAARWGAVAILASAMASGLGAQVDRIVKVDTTNAKAIQIQQVADETQGQQIGVLIAKMSSLGPGRVYAGTTSNWGLRFTVGEVPVFKYLETQGVDVMVYSPTTTTLMDDPEYYFNENRPGEYSLFGIRYEIMPTSMLPPVPATPELAVGKFTLWELPGGGYARVVDTVGTIAETRANLARRSLPYLSSLLPAEGRWLSVAFEGARAAAPTDPDATSSDGSPGTVVSESDELTSGSFRVQVRLSRTAVVSLSETYDPGWKAYVDGKPTPTEMLAPALVGVTVGPGTHEVTFRYSGYSEYPLLFVLGALGVIAGAGWPLALRLNRRRRRRLGPT
jgi:Bacterial membrane protein YfhO